MKQKRPMRLSVIMLVYNSATTLEESLRSILKQSYKPVEIIIIDNHSTDNSPSILKEFKRKSRFKAIRIIRRDKTYAVSASYNLGARIAKGDYLLCYHSDSYLPSKNETRKLIQPFIDDPSVVASGPHTILPVSVWNTFNFWQKYVFAFYVDKVIPTGNCKFDCIKKTTYLAAGGCDEIVFGGKNLVGGEDADLYLRLSKLGKVVNSDARVVHMHYGGADYSLADAIGNKARLAYAYGRVLKIRGHEFPLRQIFPILVKPILAVIPLVPYLHGFGIVLLVVFSFVYSARMFTTKSTLFDVRILMIPFLNIFLIYFELYCLLRRYLIVDKE